MCSVTAYSGHSSQPSNSIKPTSIITYLALHNTTVAKWNHSGYLQSILIFWISLWVVLWESGGTNWQISTLWWSGSSSCLVVMHECACRTLMRVAEAADCETSLLHSNWELIGCGWNNMASYGSVEMNGPSPEDGKLCSSRASNQLRQSTNIGRIHCKSRHDRPLKWEILLKTTITVK